MPIILLVTSAAVLVVVQAYAAATPVRAASMKPIPVATENSHVGTLTWMRPVLDRAIEGYAAATVAPGETLSVHVSTTPVARYRVEIYRLGWYGGVGARLIACSPGCGMSKSGISLPMPAPDPTTGEVVAGWSVTDRLDVRGWPSGYYVIELVLASGPDAGQAARVPFVVRAPASASSSAILVVAPVNTWEAYNS